MVREDGVPKKREGKGADEGKKKRAYAVLAIDSFPYENYSSE